MFSVSVAFGNQAWRLLFRTAEPAEKTFESLTQKKTDHFNLPEHIELQDDFGQRATIMRGSIHGVMLEDLDQSKVATVELMLHNTRTQVSAQQRAGSDPAIRSAQMSSGPAIISPIGNGRLS